MEETKTNFLNKLDATENDSSLVFDKINEIQISTARNKAIAGKSYFELPLWIKNKRCCVNIKNQDEKCFKWSLLAYKHFDNIKSKDKNETYHYKDILKYEPKDMTYPIDIQQDIRKFEKHNNIKINVFEYDEKDKDFKAANRDLKM